MLAGNVTAIKKDAHYQIQDGAKLVHNKFKNESSICHILLITFWSARELSEKFRNKPNKTMPMYQQKILWLKS